MSMSASATCDDPPNEQSSLLPRDYPDSTLSTSSRWSPRSLCAIVTLVVLLISLGDQLIEPAETRIVESIICYEYWEQHDPTKINLDRSHSLPGAIGGVPEALCKENSIQSSVAALRGWRQVFDGIPTLLLAVPFGWAADHVGRKPIVLLGLVAFVCRVAWFQIVCWFWQRLDIRLTWLSALSGLLGGGSPVLSSLFYVVVADIISASERAAMFLRLTAVHKSASLLAPPLCAWLMQRNPWIPCFLGTGLAIISVMCWSFMPETISYSGNPHSSSLPQPDSPGDMFATDDELDDEGSKQAPSWLLKLKSASTFLTQDWHVPVLITPFAIHMLSNKLSLLLLQYASKRYDLLLSTATLLLTIRAAVTTLTMFILIPFISKLLTARFSITPARKDLYIGCASAFITGIGYFLIAVSSTVPLFSFSLAVCTLGSGCMVVIRSLITNLVSVEHRASLFSLITVVDILGNMTAQPLLVLLFQKGMEMGIEWMGLPFIFVGGGFMAIFGLLWLLRASIR